MKSARPKTGKKISPLIILVSLAVFLISGYLFTKGSEKMPGPVHDSLVFDSEAYRNSDEFKAKHPPTTHGKKQNNLANGDKSRGKIPPIAPSGLPGQMGSKNETDALTDAIDEGRPWPFDPPKLMGNKERVSQVTEALKKVKDVELDINVYDLGLVRSIRVDENGNAEIGIIFTSLFCPYSEVLKDEMKAAVNGLNWCNTLVVTVDVERVWSRKLLTPEGRHRFKEIFGW